MSAELPISFAVGAPRFSLSAFADKSLKVTTRFWFVATVIGQLIFAFAVATYYGMTAARGDWMASSRFMTRGYVSGDTAGNIAVAMHLLSAVVIIAAGALQFVPRIRARHPVVHRWTGRVYLLAAVAISTAGLYMLWLRGPVAGDMSQKIGMTLNAVVIWICAVMALRYAIARDFRTHFRWALRLFLVVSAAWFFRAGLFLSFILFQGPVGFDPSTFTGPFLSFMVFAQYLVPLAVLELYFFVQARPGAFRRLAMAAGLVVLTLGMSAGVFGVSAAAWVPAIKAGFDSRMSIAQTLASTIESQGVGAAVRQYRQLKATAPKAYNFAERQLNTLGYQLLRAKKLKEAISIFALNLETYPQSSNAWDSLAEAYLAVGDRAQAVAHYQKALQLNPKNLGAAATLKKLTAAWSSRRIQ